MTKPQPRYRRTGATITGRCEETAAEEAESPTPSPGIPLNLRTITSLYRSKCQDALAKLPELLKAMKILGDMERIATNDRASIEELARCERYAIQLAAEFPGNQHLQDKKLMDEIDGRAVKRRQLHAEITDDEERVERLRT